MATQLHVHGVLLEGAFPVLSNDLQQRTIPPHLHPRLRTHAVLVAASPRQRIPRFAFGNFYSEVTIDQSILDKKLTGLPESEGTNFKKYLDMLCTELGRKGMHTRQHILN